MPLARGDRRRPVWSDGPDRWNRGPTPAQGGLAGPEGAGWQQDPDRQNPYQWHQRGSGDGLAAPGSPGHPAPEHPAPGRPVLGYRPDYGYDWGGPPITGEDTIVIRIRRPARRHQAGSRPEQDATGRTDTNRVTGTTELLQRDLPEARHAPGGPGDRGGRGRQRPGPPDARRPAEAEHGSAGGPESTGSVVAPLGHSPALDGLRALAVMAVMAYHAGLSWMPGGLLGVDAFFVLSGFLITSLLVAEYQATRRIDLRGFWVRRIRRLLPALLLLLLGVSAYARWVASPFDAGSVRMDALAALAYVANWRFAWSNQSYFDHFAAPSPLLHTWSLAVEEQFYLLWPLLICLVLWWAGRSAGSWRSRRRRGLTLALAAAVGGILLSALAALAMLLADTDPSRIYYGTDSRMQALLVGAALALWRARRRRPLSDRTRSLLAAAGCAAGVTMVTVWVLVDGESRGLYAGGFLAVAAVVAVLVAAAVETPQGPAARLLAAPPLPQIGRVSYGLYLWHWPVFLTVTAERTGLTGISLLLVRIAVTVVIALLSFYLVENPIRRGRVRLPVPRVTAPAAVGATAAVVLLATSVAAAPGRSRADLEELARTAGDRPQVAAAPAPGGAGPVRVLVAGDSVALTLGLSDFASMAAEQGIELYDTSMLGCGVARGMQRKRLGSVEQPPEGCDRWPTRFADRVAAVEPDVAMLLVGRWEVTDQRMNGRWTHIGNPDFDAYLARELDLAIATLSARGARVVLATTPVFRSVEAPDGSRYPETDPERVIRFNVLLREAADRHPGVATVLDVGQVLTPGNKYRESADGVRVRDPDGVHITPEGGGLIGKAIIPRLLEIARSAPPGATPASSPTPA